MTEPVTQISSLKVKRKLSGYHKDLLLNILKHLRLDYGLNVILSLYMNYTPSKEHSNNDDDEENDDDSYCLVTSRMCHTH